MIVRLTPKNLYNFFNTISAVTDLCEVFANKPIESAVPATSYIYFDIRTSSDTVAWNAGILFRRARVTLYVVWPETASWSLEQAIESIIGEIDNAILQDGCDVIKAIDSLLISKIIEFKGGESPMWYTSKDRPIKTKDYEIIYNARDT